MITIKYPRDFFLLKGLCDEGRNHLHLYLTVLETRYRVICFQIPENKIKSIQHRQVRRG